MEERRLRSRCTARSMLRLAPIAEARLPANAVAYGHPVGSSLQSHLGPFEALAIWVRRN